MLRLCGRQVRLTKTETLRQDIGNVVVDGILLGQIESIRAVSRNRNDELDGRFRSHSARPTHVQRSLQVFVAGKYVRNGSVRHHLRRVLGKPEPPAKVLDISSGDHVYADHSDRDTCTIDARLI